MNFIKRNVKRFILWHTQRDVSGAKMVMISMLSVIFLTFLAFSWRISVWINLQKSVQNSANSYSVLDQGFIVPFYLIQALIIIGYTWCFRHFRKQMIIEPGHMILRVDEDTDAVIDFGKNAMYLIRGTALWAFSFANEATRTYDPSENPQLSFCYPKYARIAEESTEFNIHLDVQVDFSKKGTIEFWQEVYSKMVCLPRNTRTSDLESYFGLYLDWAWENALVRAAVKGQEDSAEKFAQIFVYCCESFFSALDQVWYTPSFLKMIQIKVTSEIQASTLILPNDAALNNVSVKI